MRCFAVLLLVIAAVLVGCDSRDRRAQKDLTEKKRDPLAQVSPELALLEADVLMHRQLSCIMTESFANQTQREKERGVERDGGVVGEFILKMRSDAAVKCEVFTKAGEKSAPIFRAIREDGTIPERSYSFTFVEDADETSKHAVTVGLFANLPECETIEGIAREGNFATTRCRRWQPSNLFPRAKYLKKTS